MDPRLDSIGQIIDLNTWLLHNCLDGVDDALANRRVTPGTNSLAFLAAHLTDSRHFICQRAGREFPHPLGDALEKGKTLDELGPLPPIATIVVAWDTVSDRLKALLESLDAATLAQPAYKFPGSDGTLFGMLSFLTQHDSYHVGQMSILRRQLGLPAMKYSKG
jgi:uncharacterized damage-inducible protein DinB